MPSRSQSRGHMATESTWPPLISVRSFAGLTISSLAAISHTVAFYRQKFPGPEPRPLRVMRTAGMDQLGAVTMPWCHSREIGPALSSLSCRSLSIDPTRWCGPTGRPGPSREQSLPRVDVLAARSLEDRPTRAICKNLVAEQFIGHVFAHAYYCTVLILPVHEGRQHHRRGGELRSTRRPRSQPWQHCPPRTHDE